MRNKIIIQINSFKYKRVFARKNEHSCNKCDLFRLCGNVIGSPCLKGNEYFKRIRETE